jgi:hypothetical protein
VEEVLGYIRVRGDGLLVNEGVDGWIVSVEEEVILIPGLL